MYYALSFVKTRERGRITSTGINTLYSLFLLPYFSCITRRGKLTSLHSQRKKNQSISRRRWGHHPELKFAEEVLSFTIPKSEVSGVLSKVLRSTVDVGLQDECGSAVQSYLAVSACQV